MEEIKLVVVQSSKKKTHSMLTQDEGQKTVGGVITEVTCGCKDGQE